MNSRCQNNTSGFMLLEILIVIAILVFISFGIYQATTSTFKLRTALAQDGAFHNNIRLAASLLERDLSLLYSPVTLSSPSQVNPDPTRPPNDQTMAVYMSTDDLSSSSNFWGPAVESSGLRPSRFHGSSDKLSFVSASHIRIYRESQESEFAKVAYEVRRDSKNPQARGLPVLVKIESPNAFTMDDARDTQIRTYEILYGVKSLKFTYLKREGDTWKTLTSWDTDKEDTRNIYPDVIEMKIEVVGEGNLGFDGKYRFKPEMMFNGIPATF